MADHLAPTVSGSDLETALAQLNLGRYGQVLQENGFLDWSSVTEITENDMAQMDFKLGDRRKLQRLIRESASANTAKSTASSRSPEDLLRRKRPYRRHPRPDPNAPVKPKTAYVLFGEHIRQDPSLDGLSFAEIAKETGKRWKGISEGERKRKWEAPVAERLSRYREDLDSYRETEDYQIYQRYLEDFEQRRSDTDRGGSPDRHPSLNTDLISSTELISERHPNALQLLYQLEPAIQDQIDGDAQDVDVGATGDSSAVNRTEGASAAIRAGLDEVREISTNLGINPHLLRVAALPQEEIVTRSVDNFLQGTGALVYLWSREQALHQVQSMYHSPADSTLKYAIEVFAMATVGSYCDGDPVTKTFSDKFLKHFIHMLSLPLRIGDFQCMRLFACLAVCRFTNSVKSARKLMSAALDIGRQKFASSPFVAGESDQDLRHWWNVFRSIIFLESWFAYNTHQEPRITHGDLTLFTLPHPPSPSAAEVLHNRIYDLGRLATYVALDIQSAVSHPSASHARQYLDSLSQWHRTLPPPMQLSHLSLSDPLTLDWRTKRSLLQLHILFLGLFIEPYRNCLIDLGKLRLGEKEEAPDEEMQALEDVEVQCVSAARQSAGVASLLQFDSLVRSHCWVTLYTSYVGGAILLYSASQQLLQNSRDNVGLELAYASSHIGVLSVCSYENEVAKKMYTSLQILFNDVRDVLAAPMHSTIGSTTEASVSKRICTPLSKERTMHTGQEVRTNVVDIARRVLDILEKKIQF